MMLALPLRTIIPHLPDVLACTADDGLVLTAISSLEKAQATELAFVLDRGDAGVFDAIAAQVIAGTRAGVVLTSQQIPNKPCLVVRDPLAAYAALVNLAQRQAVTTAPRVAPEARVHPSAVIEAGVVIGVSAVIHAQVYVGKRCVIGNRVILYPGVRVLDDCIVGDDSIIHANTVIGSDGFGYQVSKTGMRKIPHIGIVQIGKHVEIGANCSLDRAMLDATIIGDGCKLDNAVHIAHNVRIGQSTAILAQTGIAGSVVIGAGCMIGGQVAIKDHVTIGNGVKIVSKSAVMNDIADGQTVCGIPAIPFNQWKRIAVCLQKLPEWAKLVARAEKPAQTPGSSWSSIKKLFS